MNERTHLVEHFLPVTVLRGASENTALARVSYRCLGQQAHAPCAIFFSMRNQRGVALSSTKAATLGLLDAGHDRTKSRNEDTAVSPGPEMRSLPLSARCKVGAFRTVLTSNELNDMLLNYITVNFMVDTGTVPSQCGFPEIPYG